MLNQNINIPCNEIGNAAKAAERIAAFGKKGEDFLIHELFEAQALRAPEAAAIVEVRTAQTGRSVLTYAELNRRADRVAVRLRDSGILPGDLVGVVLNRSADAIIAVLGVLKTGAAYVPLDPRQPEERLAFQFEDTGIKAIVTQPDLAVRSAEAKTVRGETVAGKEKPAMRAGRGFEERLPARSSESPAYVMYTSGSTGCAKGVIVPHRGVIRLVVGVEYVRLGPESTVLHMAPLAFDASTFEIWAPLLNGGRCVIVPGTPPSPRELGHILKEEKVDTLWLTSSLYNVVIDEEPDALGRLDQLLIGGEALSVPHVLRGLERLPNTRLINGYGPTEGTTFTCCHSVPHSIDRNTETIPIGRPIAGTRVYLLDESMREVPFGTAGEIHIGGAGVALGYLNRPRLTAEAFVPDPFDDNPESRLYKSGDLGRWREDGTLEFLGRFDDQVKIRGYRVEPGEIEVVLRRCPGVGHVAVVAREDGPGTRWLAAYLTAQAGSPPPEPEFVRSFLEERLPEYMIPSSFVLLEALPLTDNGKVDRQALPSPPRDRRLEQRSHVAPRTEVEAKLAAIWQEIFRIPSIGVDDDFFELGGDSLTGLRLVSRVEKGCGVRLPPMALIRSTTVERLAKVVEDARSGRHSANSSLIEIRPGSPRPPIVFLGGGTSVYDGCGVLYLHRLAQLLGGERPVYTFVRENFDQDIPAERLVERTAERLAEELSARFAEGPFHLAGHSFGAFLALETAHRLQSAGKSVGLTALLDPLSPPFYPRRLRWWEPGSEYRANLSRLAPYRRALRLSRTLIEKAYELFSRLTESDPTETVSNSNSIEERGDKLRASIAHYVANAKPYRGPIILFRATDRPSGFEYQVFDDLHNGLKRLVDGRIDVRSISGDHWSMMWERGLRMTAKAFDEAMREIESKDSTGS